MLIKENDNLIFSPGFHTKKNSQISTNLRNIFDKNFNSVNANINNNTNINNNLFLEISGNRHNNNLNLYKPVRNNKIFNNGGINRSHKADRKVEDKSLKMTRNFISPNIVDANKISKASEKFLKDFKNDKNEFIPHITFNNNLLNQISNSNNHNKNFINKNQNNLVSSNYFLLSNDFSNTSDVVFHKTFELNNNKIYSANGNSNPNANSNHSNNGLNNFNHVNNFINNKYDGKNILKNIPYNINTSMKQDNHNSSNTINAYHNIHNQTNTSFHIISSYKSNNNHSSNSNINNHDLNNLNFLNVKTNQENEISVHNKNNNSFISKLFTGSDGIYKKNKDLNFSSKITDSSSTLKDLIGVYGVNKKVILIF